MIEAILRSGRAMKINQDFGMVAPRPADSLVEILCGALDERLVTLNVPAPISHRDTDVVESRSYPSVKLNCKPEARSPEIWTKSSSVMKLSQCCRSVLSAMERSWF